MAANPEPREPAQEEFEAQGNAQLLPVVHTPLAVWVDDGLSCVTIVDLPRHDGYDSRCRCGGCHSSIEPDFADRFF